MKLAKYQARAMLTRAYPITSTWTSGPGVVQMAFVGPALELASEAGEVAGEFKKAYRKDGGQITKARQAAIKDELGDALWALAACADSVGLSLDDIAKANLAKLKGRAERGTIHADSGER